MAEFKKGDVVILKSGGPQMTVSNTGDYTPHGPENGVLCTWFDDKKIHNEKVFEAEALQIF